MVAKVTGSTVQHVCLIIKCYLPVSAFTLCHRSAPVVLYWRVWQLNAKLYLQLIDVEYQQPVMDEPSLLAVFDRAINSELDLDQRVAFSQRKLEFLEDFGSGVDRLYYWHHNSVCVSVMLVHAIQRVELFHNIFVPYCNLPIWLSCEENGNSVFPRGLLSTRGYEKRRDFRPVSHFISETIQDMAIIIIENEWEFVYNL